jgi:predicted transcriptional regulator
MSLVIDFGGIGINGLWLVLIAFFLYGTATSIRRSIRVEPLPLGTSVRRVMRFNVPEIPPDWPLAMFAWRYFDHAPDQAFPVMESGELLGVVTATQLEPIPRLDWGKTYVREVMLRRDRLPIVAPEDEIQAALAAIDALHAEHAPVMEHGRLVGMLNRRDITYRT